MFVVGTAPNGRIALEKLAIAKYRPNLILMDILMPEMDGFETIGHIMDRFPTPVIIVSSLTEHDIDKALTNIGMSAFESGAVEFVEKYDPRHPQDRGIFERTLLRKIKTLAKVNLTQVYKSFDFKAFLKDEDLYTPIKTPKLEVRDYSKNLIAIGASTGGPRAISLILSKLRNKFPPILVIQHMPEQMVRPWVKRLQGLYSWLKIKIPEDGERLQPNKIYVAPGSKHCAVRAGNKIKLYDGDRVNFVIPAIDVAFMSAAEVYGPNMLGIVLTGMGKDGYEGARMIKSLGGRIYIEDESTTVINSMPGAISKAKIADGKIPLHDIPSHLRRHGYIN